MTDGEGDLGQAQAALTEVTREGGSLSKAEISCWALVLGGSWVLCGHIKEEGVRADTWGLPPQFLLFIITLCLDASIKRWGQDYVSAPHRQYIFQIIWVGRTWVLAAWIDNLETIFSGQLDYLFSHISMLIFSKSNGTVFNISMFLIQEVYMALVLHLSFDEIAERCRKIIMP